jgi:hypothetical protein
MIADDTTWRARSEDERSGKIRVSELNVKSLDELRYIVRARRVTARARRRVQVFLALEELLGDEAFEHLSLGALAHPPREERRRGRAAGWLCPCTASARAARWQGHVARGGFGAEGGAASP